MQITLYRNQIYPAWLGSDSFVVRNPNMSYLLSSGRQGAPGALVDACGDPERIAADIAQKRLQLDYILLTHSHLDHIPTLAELAARFPEVRIGIHPSSLDSLASRGFANLLPLEDGAAIRIDNEELKVVHTPGHSWDSVSFWDRRGNLFFSGDTIFGGGIGCAAYDDGGTRNGFYRTIRRLLELLPPETLLYPGHSSEHYQTPPPYKLSEEKKKNPYLRNALGGRRGDFDRDLRAFSAEFELNDGVMLAESELDDIMALERAIWIPELQAPRERFRERLRQGHRILAIKRSNSLVGMIGWRYSGFSIRDAVGQFPKDFSGFSAGLSPDKAAANSAFIYSVGVRPEHREKGMGSLLLQYTVDKIREEGVNQIFVDSRMPAYNGSPPSEQENIPPDPQFREAIDRYLASHRFPTEDEFFADPRIRFYLRNGFRPWLIVRDFIQDKASGNLRAVCYLNTEEDEVIR